jgi:hypothetical protein
MNPFTVMLTSIALLAVQSEQQPPPSNRQQDTPRPSGDLQQRIAPGLATLTDDVLFGDVWRRSRS